MEQKAVLKPKKDKQLMNYIDSMLKQKYDVEMVRQQLEQHGYTKETIEEHIHDAINPKQETLSFFDKVYIIIFTALMVLLIGMINIWTEAPPANIFLGFLPVFLTIVSVLIFYEISKTSFKIVITVLPLIFCAAFYAISVSGSFPIFDVIDSGNVTFLNFAICILFIVLFNILQPYNKYITKKTTKESGYSKKGSKDQIKTKSKDQEITEYIQSIEDKSKALNFVIGRVYSAKHGGSDRMREKLRIDKEWYNEFTELAKQDFMKNVDKLYRLVWNIADRLNVLYKTEYQVFGKEHESIKNIERADDGSDKIIDVLIRNDKDPVDTYYQSAVDFCQKAVNELNELVQKKR